MKLLCRCGIHTKIRNGEPGFYCIPIDVCEKCGKEDFFMRLDRWSIIVGILTVVATIAIQFI